MYACVCICIFVHMEKEGGRTFVDIRAYAYTEGEDMQGGNGREDGRKGGKEGGKLAWFASLRNNVLFPTPFRPNNPYLLKEGRGRK